MVYVHNVKCKPEYFGDVFTLIPDYMKIYPKDALGQFGNMNEMNSHGGKIA